MSHRGWFDQVALVCIVACVSCSDSRDPNKADGLSGTGGGGTSGLGGTGGSRAGTGGAGIGGVGTGGAGGTGMNPVGCPATAPSDGSACMMVDLSCSYAPTECQCDSDEQWDCSMGGGTMQVCPATEPANGSGCTPGRGDCAFGDRICDCVRDTDNWACWHPDDCPADPPDEDSACPLVGMECPYEVGGGSDECDCEDTGWDCGGGFGDQDAGM